MQLITICSENLKFFSKSKIENLKFFQLKSKIKVFLSLFFMDPYRIKMLIPSH